MKATLPPLPYTDRLMSLPPPMLNSLVAILLSACVEANDKHPSKGVITRFHAKEKPPLEIEAYLTRLTVYTPFTRDAILLAVLALDRISRLQLNPESPEGMPTTTTVTAILPNTVRCNASSPVPSSALPESPPTLIPLVNSFTVHRLLMATLLCCSKCISDGFIPQSRAAKVGGVSMKELVRLEVEVLKVLNWSIAFTLEELESVSAALLRAGEEANLIEVFTPPSIHGETPLIPTQGSTAAGVSTPSTLKVAYGGTIVSPRPFASSSLSPSSPVSSLCNEEYALDSSPITSTSSPSHSPQAMRSSFDDHDALSGRKMNSATESASTTSKAALHSRKSSETVRRLDMLCLGVNPIGEVVDVH